MIVLKDFRREGGLVACACEGAGLPAELWFRTDAGASPVQDWAAIALLYPAMALGRDLHVGGAVSRSLLHALNDDVQALLTIHDPRLRRISVTAAERHDRAGEGGGTATGFSAGVDSFATLALHPEVSLLTVFNVGALGAGDDAALFARYVDRARNFAEARGIAAAAVDSNLSAFFDAIRPECPTSFEQTHTIRNAAAAHVLGVSNYLYSSAYDYREVLLRRKETGSMGYLDPTLLPLLSTRSLRLHSAGASHTRGGKTALIGRMPEAQALLDVCVGDPAVRATATVPNCSRCWKCVRTIVTLEALGTLEAFGRVFDLDAYRRHSAGPLFSLVRKARGGDAVAREAVDLARAAGVPLPSDGRVVLNEVRNRMRLGRRLRSLVGARRAPIGGAGSGAPQR